MNDELKMKPELQMIIGFVITIVVNVILTFGLLWIFLK